MIRFLVRVVAVVMLAAAFAALVVDGTESIAAGALLPTPFGTTLLALFPKQFPLIEPAVERYIHPLLWKPVLVDLFVVPTFAVLAVLGLLLLWVAQRRHVKIGYSSRP